MPRWSGQYAPPSENSLRRRVTGAWQTVQGRVSLDARFWHSRL
jgi:hypothetical protein